MYLNLAEDARSLPNRLRALLIGGVGAVIAAALLWSSAPARAANLTATPLPFAGGASTLIVGPDGALWFASKERDEIDRYDPAFGALQRFPLLRHEDEGENEGPTDLAAGAEGQVWYATDDGREVGRVSPAGKVQSIQYSESDLFVGHISAAPGGGVWESVQLDFNDSDHDLKLLRENGVATTYPYEGEFSSGGPISTAPDGSAWVGDWGARISSITPAGAVTSYNTAIASTEEINSIDFAPDGTVWYAGFYPGAFAAGEGGVAYASASGGSIGRLVPGGAQQGFKIGQNTLAGSLSSGGDGSMWFAVRGGVGRIDGNGAYQLGSTAPYQPGQFNSPSNLVFGPQGALWLIDDEKSVLVRVAVDGALFPPPPPPPAPAPAPTPAPRKSAPRARIKGKKVHVVAIEKRKGIALTCEMKGAGTCAVRASIDAKSAKELHLKVAKKAKVLVLGQASRDFKKAESQQLLVKLKPKVLRALRHLRRGINLILQITASAPGATPVKAIEELGLRR